jgi:hypothetical protein
MSTYIVTRKSDAAEIYRYSASLPIEWQGMSFATHDHTALLEQEPVQQAPSAPRRLTKLAFIGRLGSDFATILVASKQSVQVEMFVRMLDWVTPDPDGTSVDLDDLRVIGALQALEAGGIIAAGRAQEILNG